MTVEQHFFVQFQDGEGISAGKPVSIPAGSTPQQLEALVNQFLGHDTEIVTSLEQDILSSKNISKEGILSVVYQPQAVFRVKAVSRCTSTLAGHEDAILCVSFSPDGRRLATGSGDKTVRLWDLSTETPWKLGSVHTGWVLCLSWSPDGKLLASGSMDNTVCVWDAKTGGLVCRLAGHRQWITSLSWEPLHLSAPSVLLASSSKDGTVKVWDVFRKTCTMTLSQHTDAVTCVKWGGDGTIYSASRDRTIRMWHSDGRLKGQLLGHAHWINTLALSTDHVLRTGAFDHNGEISSPSDVQYSAKLRYDAAVGTQGERLISGSDDFTLFLWNPSISNKPVARLTGHQALVNHVSFSPDGRYLASASFDKSVKLWNGVTGQFLSSLRGHVGRAYQVAWSADSRLLMSSSQDSTLKVWDVRTRTLKQDLPGHADEVYAVDWSPIGDRGASGGKDKLLKLWRQ
ncbi:Rsa4p [Paramicrosporidium saccamoebae]|uniref:Rsa4p n=1 Tax=Paramicrosporidium saccamoebae TaxID=1246581 RepID=A0A2H9TFT9_9FUNG|nr:Rsa4p [Paramicrosporidium saccamoebae]